MSDDLEEELVKAASSLDIQRCTELLQQGVCLNLYTTQPRNQPLHSVVLHEDGEESRQIALTQLLLVNGADPDLVDSAGHTVLDLALKSGKKELIKLLQDWGAKTSDAQESLVESVKEKSEVTVKFHQYVFEEEHTNEPAILPSHGKRFLQQVACIFEDKVTGSPEIRESDACSVLDDQLDAVYDQLASVGFTTPVPSSNAATEEEIVYCSTPRLGIPKNLNVSQISSIREINESFSNPPRNCCKKLFNNSIVIENEAEKCISNSDSRPHSGQGHVHSQEVNNLSLSFHSCKSQSVSNVALALANSRLSVSQEFIVTDPVSEISFIEQRRPSLLSVALQDQSLLDQLQLKAEEETGQRSLLASSSSTSSSSEIQRTYLRWRQKQRYRVKEEDWEDFGKYPDPMTKSMKNVSSITRDWICLSHVEEKMAKQFTNLPDEVTETVNLLTRETACKTSFNYLLLDPGCTNNLPMKVFLHSDQTLWRTFIASLFYIGKGTRSRPFHHLYEAAKECKPKKSISAKIARIQSIWSVGLGVVVVQMFHNTIAVEAFTREAAMIDAVGCDNLTNVRGGDYYGIAATWSQDKKLKLGTFLLYKAFKIFLQEGERQIRPVDLRG